MVDLYRCLSWAAAGALLVAGGCDGGGGGAPADGGLPDGATAEHVEDLPVEQERSLAGVEAAVEVVQDERGMWHVYASSTDDAMRVEGYLMARDRMAQMELFRRLAKGELAEIIGSLDEAALEQDKQARFEGHLRNARKVEEELDDEMRQLLAAFAEGVTAHVEELRSGEASLPEGIPRTLSETIGDWEVVDTLSIVRFMMAALSIDAAADVNMTQALSAYRDKFPASSEDPAVAARAGAFHDLYPLAPARPVWVMDGFPNLDEDSGSRAFLPPGFESPAAGARPEPVLPSEPVLRGAQRFLDALEQRYRRVFGPDGRGSNSWVLHGSNTASGNPILANDPHLELLSPSLFWYVHLDTKRSGAGDLNVQGLALTGTPIVLLGYNEHIAWGLTTHHYDVTDVYHETITPGSGGEPDTVRFGDRQIPIETITERIPLEGGGEEEYELERVPHHGIIIPDSRTDTEALTMKWTGNEATREPYAVFGLNLATSVEEARDALDDFGVGSQTFVIASREGDIFYTSQGALPVRDNRAVAYDPGAQTGTAPCFVLDGTGPHEWVDMLSDRYIPHVLNPDAGFIATANGDAVGVTADGNPFNDPHYIGWNFANGHRIARITERLEELVAEGDVTPGDMQRLQADAQSPYGRTMTDALIAELDRAAEELDSPGTHGDLERAIAERDADTMAKVIEARDRLAEWTYDTPAAVEDDAGEQAIADSVATTIFNVAYGYLGELMLRDEIAFLGYGGRALARTVQWALVEPERLASYDEEIGDTWLWDHMATDDVLETRGDRIVRAFATAVDKLTERLGEDMDEWRWGKLHTIRLDFPLPGVGRSIPPRGSERFPDGFPRHGDRGVVDASAFATFATADFSYDLGPVQRLVVEMTPDGPEAYNAISGGQSMDPNSPHHADEMELWRNNEAPPMHFVESDVVAHAERRQRFVP